MDWDVFISYASEERQWVVDNLFEPLSRCRTVEGERPRIFFDEKGIDVSQNWQQALAEAITESHKVIPVYSRRYFQKPMCQWELGLFWTLDPIGDLKKINPVLIESEAENNVPIQYSLIHYLYIGKTDWFERLCHGLQLSIEKEPTVLTFIDQPPAEIAVNHTLPALTVQMKVPAGQAGEEQIEIYCPEAQLHGTVARQTENGMAVFDDLSLGAPAPEVRLIAAAKGCDAAQSITFQVLPPAAVTIQTPVLPTDQTPQTFSPQIKGAGEAVFFAGGTRLVVLGEGKATVYDLQGKQMGPRQDVDDTLRLISPTEQLVALVDWWGRILVLGPDGPILDWEGPPNTEGLSIAGDLAVNGNQFYLGYWTGDVFHVELDQPTPPVRLLHHPEGIGRLAWADDSLFMADLQGRLLRNREMDNTEIARIESRLYLLKPFAGCLVAVGDTKLYHIQLNSNRIFGEMLPTSFSTGLFVLGQSHHPVVIDSQGKGLRFDADLKLVVRFATGPGAVPVSADDAGIYCVLKNADGSLSLMIRDRIVFTHLGGTLAVAQDGRHFAVGDESGIRIVRADEVRSWIGET